MFSGHCGIDSPESATLLAPCLILRFGPRIHITTDADMKDKGPWGCQLHNLHFFN